MFENVVCLKQPTVTVIQAIHPVLGAVTIFDRGEYITYGLPGRVAAPHGRTLIGQKSRLPLVIYDFAAAPALAEQGVDNTAGMAYGNHVADWCNRLIDQARLSV